MLPPNKTDLFEFFEFHKNGKTLQNAPVCGLTLLKAGSMRFRWNEFNQNRTEVFSLLSEAAVEQSRSSERTIIPVQLRP